MKASDLFIRCLEAEGVEYIFGVPGEENADIMISLLDSKIRFIPTRHEQAAAFMADGYGRLTGKPACCLGTLGPGATNLLTGVGDANMDRAPLIVLTGQAETTRIHKESHQAMDLVALFRPCVKWGISVQHPDSIPEIIRKAFRIATTDKYGACHIDLPENVAKMQTLAQPIPPLPVRRSAPNMKAVDEAAAVIKGANFPVILAGNGIFRNTATAEVRALAHATGIPVTNTFMGKGVLTPDDDLCLFTIGLGARDFPAAALERADCVIAIGFDMVEYHPKAWNRGNDKKIVYLDTVPSEVDENFRTAVEVVGDIALGVSALTAALEGMPRVDASLYKPFRDAMHASLHADDDDPGYPIKPQRVLAEVRKALDDRDIVFSDVGAHKMWISRYLHTAEPNTIQISNGFCSMGFALPGAIGAKLAYPDRRVLAICGDGGVMMNIQDLETAVREDLPIVVMVWQDGRYGLIKWKQEAHFGTHSKGLEFTNPDWVKLAEAFHMNGYWVERAEDLGDTIKRAFDSGKSSLIAFSIDYSENMKLTATLKKIPFERVCDRLASVPLFARIPEHYRRTFATIMEEQEIAAGTPVFQQGEPGDALYVIHKGEAAVVKDGAEVATLGAGRYFGEMAAISDAPRSASIVAKSDLVVARLDGAAFRDIVRSEPDVCLSLARTYAERLLETRS